MWKRLSCTVGGLVATLLFASIATAQGFFARGDATCSVTLSAADVLAEVRALGGNSVCGNDDCDRDGTLTPADASCAATCLFGECLIPSTAPAVTNIAADSAPTIVPLSAVRITGTQFGSAERLKRVTIGGVNAEIVGLIAPDTLQVVVPAALPPGPADVVVFNGDLPGPASQITIAAPVPLGPGDTFDGTLALLDTAAALLLALDLESAYGPADGAGFRQSLQRFRIDLAAQRAALVTDPNFTADVRARVDAAFDSSGTPEQLRQLIMDIETLLAGSGGGAALADLTVAVVVSRFAATGALLAAQAGSTAPLVAAPAAPLLGIGLPAVVAITAVVALVAGGAYLASQNSRVPVIYSVIFEDGNGASRLAPTAGGVVHVAGKNFLPTADLVVRTAYGEFTAQRLELTDETLAARLPTDSGFCGSAALFVAKALDNRVKAFDTHIQPILNEVRPAPPDVVNPGEEFDLVVRGVAPCSSAVVYKGPVSLDDDATGIEQLPLVTLVTVPMAAFPPGNYTARIKIEDTASNEELPFEVGNPIKGLKVACTSTHLAVPPGTPSTASCSATIDPQGEVPPIGSKWSWNSDGSNVVVSNVNTASTTATAVKLGSAKVHAELAFGPTVLGKSSDDPTITVTDKTAPTISISSTAMATVNPGSSIDVMVSASDNVGLGTISLKATGDAVTNPAQETLECIGEKMCSPSFTVSLKDHDFMERTVTIQAEALDAGLNKGTSNQLSFTIAKDTSCPFVLISSPSDGGTVNAGSTVEVVATATDNGPGDTGVKHFIYSATGDALVAAVSQDLPFPMPLPAPDLHFTFSVKKAADLAGVMDKTITVSVEAVDDAGNSCGPDVITLTAIGTLDHCDGGISAFPESGCDGMPFTVTVVISGANADKITRVTSTNPGCMGCDLQKQSDGSYQITLFYQGQGSFTLDFTAFDADGNGLCSGSIGLTATGVCQTSDSGADQTALRLPAGAVAGGTQLRR